MKKKLRSKRLEDTPKTKRPRNIKPPTFEPKWNTKYTTFNPSKVSSRTYSYRLRNDVV